MDSALVARLAAGTTMLKYCANMPPHARVVRLDVERRVVSWSSPTKLSSRTTIHIQDIQEIRRGQRTARFAEFPWEEKDSFSFSIIYGASFSTLDLICNTAQEREEWVETLLEMMAQKATSAKGVDPLKTMLNEAWERAAHNANQQLRVQEVTELLRLLNIPIPKKILRESFAAKDKDGKDRMVNFEEFSKFYQDLRFREEIANLFRSMVPSEWANLSLDGMRKFCVDVQHMTFATDAEFEDMIRPYLNADRQVSLEGFARFLEEAHAAIYNLPKRKLHHDMTRPLHEYYINSSHNTYLSGHQLHGKSTVEAYARALQLGCRCVELDCWDGANNHPQIYHGHTLTTRLLFRDVIATINDYAFRTSPYPVILSFENHCSVAQQVVMAKVMLSTFGDRLIQAPLTENETVLPSPESLRYKILVKASKGSPHLPFEAVDASTLANQSPPEADAEFDSDDENEAVMGSADFSATSASTINLAVPGTMPAERRSIDRSIDSLRDEASEASASKSSTLRRPPSQDGHRPGHEARRLSAVPAGAAPTMARKPAPRRLKVADELSALVVYTRPTKLHAIEEALATSHFNYMFSLSEKKSENFAKTTPDLYRTLTRRHNTRIYPAGTRVDSSNFDPRVHWGMGCQMVALNFQTADRGMHLNLSRFEENAQSGYLLKPEFLRSADAKPMTPLALTVEVISGNQLSKPGDNAKNDPVNPFVEVEMLGEDVDDRKQQTAVVLDNGWHPLWSKTFDFEVEYPELAFLRIAACDNDNGRIALIGSYIVPVLALGQGYRHVPLWDAGLNRIPYTSLFVNISVRPRSTSTHISRSSTAASAASV